MTPYGQRDSTKSQELGRSEDMPVANCFCEKVEARNSHIRIADGSVIVVIRICRMELCGLSDASVWNHDWSKLHARWIEDCDNRCNTRLLEKHPPPIADFRLSVDYQSRYLGAFGMWLRLLEGVP
ncbi:hypothetical protein AHAS_Ahas20G0246300 [Arachis hypogaea]